MIYILATIISVFFSYSAVHSNNINGIRSESKGWINVFFILLSCIPLTFISAFRFSVGADYWSYYNIYANMYASNAIEPGFMAFNKILHFFSSDPYFFFAVTSVIICGSYFWSIYKYSINPFYSILLFLLSREFLTSMSLTRMYLAIALTLFAFPQIKEKKLLNVLIITAIAMCFHISALIILPLYIIYCMKLTPQKGIAILAIMAAVLGSIYSLVRWIAYNFSFFANKLYYFVLGERTAGIDPAWSYIFIYLFIFICMSIIYRSVKENKIFLLAYAASFVGTIFALFTVALPSTMDRFLYYINSFFVIYIPETVEILPFKKYKKIINIAIVICYIAWYVWGFYFREHAYSPYKFIWD